MTISIDAAEPIKIILIDDDHDILHICALMFKGALGAVVKTFSSAGAARQQLLEFSPDFLICDQRLESGASGLDFLVKSRAEGFKGKLVLMSGYVSAELRESALSTGVDFILEKPISRATIIQYFGDDCQQVMPRSPSSVVRASIASTLEKKTLEY